MIKTEVVAMLLAGGQGSRLKNLTKNIAKPAVAFGGKYKIIDFALSNATNSNIKDIGILTQYKPLELNSHLGIGKAWDFDTNSGGLRVLPPYMTAEGGRWYVGTANAIYENMDYIESLKPKYVLILSGDHIYKMNYNKMLKDHIKNKAAVSIAVMEVPWEETSRFGILNVDDNNKIYEFDEKPENAKSNLASMGIYIFDWEILKTYLIIDHLNKESSADFGNDVLPLMLSEDQPMYAYPFQGYWKDVGTVYSYWEASMDLLDENNTLNLFDRDWRIYTHNLNLPPQYVSEKAKVSNSMLNEGCVIKGEVINSVLSCGVIVEEGAVVKDSVLLSNVVIKKDAVVNKAIVIDNVVVNENQKINPESDGIYLVDFHGVVVNKEE